MGKTAAQPKELPMGCDAFEPLRYGVGEERIPDLVQWQIRHKAFFAAVLWTALGGALLFWSGHVAWGTVAVVAAGTVGAWFVWKLQRRTVRWQRELVLDTYGLWLETRGRPRSLLFAFVGSFGVSLLSNRTRDRLVMALSCGAQSLYIGAALNDADRRTHRELLSRASTMAEEEMVFDAIGNDSQPLSLRMMDLESLLRVLLQRDHRALDRCFLSDTFGEPVVLDGQDLRVGGMAFDLRAPLDWSASLFQEPFGSLFGGNDWDPRAPPAGGVMVYQATWIRQGASEVVLVSLLPSLAVAPVAIEAFADQSRSVQVAVLRDLRLMQATPGAPPPHDLRVGIDRTYVIRLRAALDQAPRTNKKSEGSPRASRGSSV